MTSTETQIEQSRRALGEPVLCMLHVLTPVHIGCGVKWQAGVDFVVDRDGTYLVPEPLLLAYLHEHPERIAALEEQRRRTELLREVEGGVAYTLPCNSQHLLAFLREGNGRPLVPGSSLKGALRTVLFRHFWEQLPARTRAETLREVFRRHRPNRKWDSQILQQAALGKDPNHDLLRALAPGDAFFRQEDLDLKRIFILNRLGEDDSRFGWKNVPRRRSSDRIHDATPIYAEMLRPGMTAGFRLHLDRFLLEHPKARAELHFKEKAFDAATLSRWANRYARARLERERRFLERRDDGTLIRLLNNVDVLLRRIPAEGSEEEGQRFLLRLGWSSGWNAMTGDYLDGDELDQVRRRYRLGKKDSPVFPKTRKIVFEGNEPTYLAGWVEIRLDEAWQPAPGAEAKAEAIEAAPVPGAEPTAATLPEGVETGTVHSLNLKKGYGKIQPDDGDEPIRFDFADADMTGLNKGAPVVFRREEAGGEPRAAEVRKRS